MTNEEQIYNELLNTFGSTLKESSKDDHGKSPCEFMTESPQRVVKFDLLKERAVRNSRLPKSPVSCDALYRNGAGEWFLIEFKNGILEDTRDNRKPEDKSKGKFKPESKDFYEIIRKLLESLLLLMEELGQTIEFTRRNIVFILVYNEDTNPFLYIKDSATKLGHKNEPFPMSSLMEILPCLPDDKFNVSYFDKLYLKKALVCSKSQFETAFIAQYVK